MAKTLKPDTEETRKKLNPEGKERYLKGEGKSISWKRVKNNAFNKAQRDGLLHNLSKKAKHTQMGLLSPSSDKKKGDFHGPTTLLLVTINLILVIIF